MLENEDLTRDRTKSFLERCIRSLDDLQVLLHLHADRGHMQGIEPIARAVRVDGETIVVSVGHLLACDLLELQGSGSSVTCAYAPGSQEIDAAVNDLARLYEHSRFDVVSWIMAHSVERIRRETSATFARIMRAQRISGQ
jgi:hypothetical protein